MSSSPLDRAQSLPNGARFYRCSLQINPFAYLERHGKQTTFDTEEDYNQAIVDACQRTDIEVVAVTDHYRFEDSQTLVNALRRAGIFVFPGFEAVTKDGVHFLCLFDLDQEDALERIIGDCGVHDKFEISPTGKFDSSELLSHAKNWKAMCIAAHVEEGGGLLHRLKGQPRANVWKSPDLLACAIRGRIDDAPEGIRPILLNKDPAHKRNRPVAVMNASDVIDPTDLEKESASCFIKMSEVSVEALRQAFLDSESRIRLNSDPEPEPHAEFVALAWEGGFLRNTCVHFNGNLNVLVGGRGAGKSTLIESLRYALGMEPLGDDAKSAHKGVIQKVLGPGTKISLSIRSHKPAPRRYTIERSVPNPPVVKDDKGDVIALTPSEVMPNVEIYGQHEVSELTKSREKLTRLLQRFVDSDPDRSAEKAKIRRDLERSRRSIVGTTREMQSLSERLEALPALEETERRFREAGLEERLKEKSLVLREEKIFESVEERVSAFRTLRKQLRRNLPIDLRFLAPNKLSKLPNSNLLGELSTILEKLSEDMRSTVERMDMALSESDKAIGVTRDKWEARRKKIEEDYEKKLRDLQRENIDGSDFIQLRQQIEDLQPLREEKARLSQELSQSVSERRNLLADWEDAKAKEYRELRAAARKVSRKLRNRVRVEVSMAGNREPLERLLREVGGNLSAALDRLRSVDQLSLVDLAQRCHEGKEALITHYSLPAGAAQRIASADSELFMRIEELDLPATTKIELNTAPDGAPATWQTLEALSTGQKATAVLLLLLLESEAPLVVDQPEDDLDNRFISDGVVPIMRQEKRRRQFIFSTHNANIPVLGDAELILGLSASGEGGEGRATIERRHMGSIDSKPVCELVEEILEGGKDAFEMRRSKYGF